MLICPVCFYVNNNDVTYWRCLCGTVVTKQTTAREIQKREQLPRIQNPWETIHKYLAQQIKNPNYNSIEAKNYHDTEWMKLVPGCCIGNYLALINEIGIDWSTAQTAFYSLWLIHNEVSTRHSNRPTITYKQCEELYLGPQSTTTSNDTTFFPQEISLEAGNNPGVGD